jgi:NAD(P)-dependent dehydrogenase (short-subunit alcohol dehydrogenase family)
MTIVFGSTGSIGSHFCEHTIHKPIIFRPTKEEFDMANPNYAVPNEGVKNVVFAQGLNPEIIANQNASRAREMMALNVLGPLEVIEALHNYGNTEMSFVFIGSISARKGSVDPSYAAAKSALDGMMASLVKSYPDSRFNTLSLGLVSGSRIAKAMGGKGRRRHALNMGGRLVQKADVTSAIDFILSNGSMNNSNLSLDRGFRL